MVIPFYFDYACPWAYLASCRVEPYFSDLGGEIDFRPVHLARLKEPSASSAAEPGERKKRNYVADFRHWAEMIGVELAPSAKDRPRPETRLLLKAALLARDEGRFREFHYPAYRARWAEGLDVGDPEVVKRLLEAAGLDAERTLERAQTGEFDERLDSETDEAITRGVFGVPTLFVGDKLFWGNDRFELIRYYLQKRVSA